MSYIDGEMRTRPARRFGWFMLALLILSVAYLVYGADFEYTFAGFGALFAVPFSIGALITQTSLRGYSVWGCLLAPILLFAVIFPLVYFGMAEGLVCIAMVMPIWLVAGLGGGLYTLINNRALARENVEDASAQFRVVTLAALPLALLYVEEVSPPQWQSRMVEREITIAASPEDVWPLLVSIPDISGDEGEFTFTHNILGVARPGSAQLVQRDGGLVRKARWGKDIKFEEIVDNFAPGQMISWRFAFPDGSVQAYTDRHISPDGPILKIDRGGYRMEHAPGGQTRLKLWTRYHMRSRLGWYMDLWGQLILGDVQDNVLHIIRDRAQT